MIEQTDLVVNTWHYTPPAASIHNNEQLAEFTFLDVQRKTASTKKGIACRFTCRFTFRDETVLEYIAQDSYVIDLNDAVSTHDLYSMISNAHAKFAETFDFRKLGTVLQNSTLRPLDASLMNLEVLLPQLKL